jgi:hypothetical protein
MNTKTEATLVVTQLDILHRAAGLAASSARKAFAKVDAAHKAAKETLDLAEAAEARIVDLGRQLLLYQHSLSSLSSGYKKGG